ncbi:hypothetical protein GGI19_005172 [Coemansia pectinata]|nr:hypothetical protein GGI19_005172 [Coemansia pectinata]
MDSRELGRAIERSVLGSAEDAYEIRVSPTPVRRYEAAVSRRTSNSSVSSSSSAGCGRASGRITRPGRARRGSITGESMATVLGLSPAVTPSKLGSSGGAQLTPRANRQGGILKAGRTMRVKPVRLHTLAEMSPAELATPPAQPWLDAPSSPRAVTRTTRSLSIADDEAVREPGQRMGRSARPLRKSVRFPEELRLLETIRMIDPRAAQTIESRATLYEPPPPPPVRTSSDDESVPLTGLAARIRYSPRLAPKSAAPSPDMVMEALPLDDAIDHLQLDSPASHYVRPPLPPSRAGRIIDDDMPFGCLEPGRQRRRSNSIGDGRAQGHSDSFILGAAFSSLGRPPLWASSRSNVRGSLLHVGPNIASAHSSPLTLAPGGGPAAGSVSSLSSSSEGLVAGATHSAHLYPTELTAFGDAQIPTIACGRDTAFRASELTYRHVQGPDIKRG